MLCLVCGIDQWTSPVPFLHTSLFPLWLLNLASIDCNAQVILVGAVLAEGGLGTRCKKARGKSNNLWTRVVDCQAMHSACGVGPWHGFLDAFGIHIWYRVPPRSAVHHHFPYENCCLGAYNFSDTPRFCHGWFALFGLKWRLESFHMPAGSLFPASCWRNSGDGSMGAGLAGHCG